MHAGLKKITAISSRAENQSSSRPPSKRGGSGFRQSDSTRKKDSSRCWKDQRSGSSPQKLFQGGGGWPFRGGRGGGRGGRGCSTSSKPSGSSKGKGRGSRSGLFRDTDISAAAGAALSTSKSQLSAVSLHCPDSGEGKVASGTFPSFVSRQSSGTLYCREDAGCGVASLPPSVPRESLAGDILCLREDLPVAGRLR